MKRLFWMLVVVMLFVPTAVFAQSWDSALTTGLTGVEASLTDNTWEFILTNQSDVFIPEWDILVWSLEPFNVPAPSAVTMPAGWEWKDAHWEQYVVDPTGKYYMPPALAPGENYTFTLSFDAGADPINLEPSLNGQLGFLSHVGAVIPGSGNTDGTDMWDSYTVAGLGDTWHDRSGPVPEPSSILALGAGLVGLCGFVLRRR